LLKVSIFDLNTSTLSCLSWVRHC